MLRSCLQLGIDLYSLTNSALGNGPFKILIILTRDSQRLAVHHFAVNLKHYSHYTVCYKSRNYVCLYQMLIIYHWKLINISTDDPYLSQSTFSKISCHGQLILLQYTLPIE